MMIERKLEPLDISQCNVKALPSPTRYISGKMKSPKGKLGSKTPNYHVRQGGFWDKKMNRMDTMPIMITNYEARSTALMDIQKKALEAFRQEALKYISIAPEDRRRRHMIVITNYIKRIPFFSRFSHKERYALAECLIYESYSSGQSVYNQGDDSNGYFYIILSGGCVMTTTRKMQDGKYQQFHLRQLITGDSFGELALLQNERRMSNIYADNSGVDVIILQRKDYIRLYGNDDIMEKEKIEFLQKLTLFSQLKLKSLKSLVKSVTLKRYRYNESIIVEGEELKFIYFIVDGVARITHESLIISTTLIGAGEYIGVKEIGSGLSTFPFSMMTDSPELKLFICEKQTFLKYIPIESIKESDESLKINSLDIKIGEKLKFTKRKKEEMTGYIAERRKDIDLELNEDKASSYMNGMSDKEREDLRRYTLKQIRDVRRLERVKEEKKLKPIILPNINKPQVMNLRSFEDICDAITQNDNTIIPSSDDEEEERENNVTLKEEYNTMLQEYEKIMKNTSKDRSSTPITHTFLSKLTFNDDTR